MKVMLLIGCVVASVFTTEAQTNFYTTVTNLWYQGYKSNVLAMAEARLQQNTNDIAGLIIKVEFDIDFTRDDRISNSVQRVLAIGPTIQTTNFAKVFPEYRDDLIDLLEEVRLYPLSGDELLKEQAKGNFIGLQLFPEKEFEALQKDGYFD
jgi:hypothetical protein